MNFIRQMVKTCFTLISQWIFQKLQCLHHQLQKEILIFLCHYNKQDFHIQNPSTTSHLESQQIQVLPE